MDILAPVSIRQFTGLLLTDTLVIAVFGEVALIFNLFLAEAAFSLEVDRTFISIGGICDT
ncbi:unnamed protein product [Meloidogyne enterolobii]|uniref:Uncharacterized protein n=2 Tax=Meloidogyne enterolobii TaxID=390850 RepID=A0ACB1B6Y7_MELEN